MKKHLIAFMLVFMMLLSMPLTVMGGTGFSDAPPPQYEPQIICSMFVIARGGPGGAQPPCCDDYY